MLSFEVSIIDVVLAMAIIIILVLQVKNSPNDSVKEQKLRVEKKRPAGDLSESLAAWKTPSRKESATTATEDSTSCPFQFGYLKTLPLGSSVPEGCYECPRVRECLVSHQ